MSTPIIRFGESRILSFPMFDFNGQASSTNLTAGTTTLTLGTEGWWAIYGISATGCLGADGTSLATGSNMNIQILDVNANKYFFTYASNWALTGAPIEHVAGKYGNPHWLGYPMIFAPGTRLLLYASQTSGSTPSTRSPLYVALHAVLTSKPIPGATLGSFQKQTEENSGAAYAMTTKMVFSGAAANNLLLNQSRTNASPINRDLDFYVNSIVCRNSTIMSTSYQNSVDPRSQEVEILLSVRDSIAQSAFVQPDPIPVCLMAGLFGAREFSPATYFHVNPNADLVTTVVNNRNITGSPTLSTDLEITFQGSMLKR